MQAVRSQLEACRAVDAGQPFYAIFASLFASLQTVQGTKKYFHQKGVAPILLMHISSTIAVPDNDKR